MISGTKEVEADRMTQDLDLEVILIVAIVDLGLDLVREVMEGIHILGHTHDLGHDPEAVHLPFQGDKGLHHFLTSVESPGKHQIPVKMYHILRNYIT